MRVDLTHLTRARAARAAAAAISAAGWLASPSVTASLASNAGGADRSRPPTFGDCKNVNPGVHNGYDCEVEVPPGG